MVEASQTGASLVWGNWGIHGLEGFYAPHADASLDGSKSPTYLSIDAISDDIRACTPLPPHTRIDAMGT